MSGGQERRGSRTEWYQVTVEGEVFDVRVEYVVTDEASTPVAIEVRSREGEPITREILRSLQFPPPSPVAEVSVLPVRRDDSGGLVLDEHGFPEPVGAEVRRGPGAPRQYGDAHYAAIARAVLDAERDNLPVWETVRKAFKLGSDRTVARHIQEARDRGFLPAARRKER